MNLPKLPRAARSGFGLIFVCSNSGEIASGASTFRLEPSALRAAVLPTAALGDTGDCMPASHAAATAAHTTNAANFISNRYFIRVPLGQTGFHFSVTGPQCA